MLQATNNMQLQHGNTGNTGPGLLPVEQRAEPSVLRVRFVQGGRARGHPEGLAQALRPQHRHACLTHWHLLNWLLCLPKHQEGTNGLSIW